jgi:hypothetical protein
MSAITSYLNGGYVKIPPTPAIRPVVSVPQLSEEEPERSKLSVNASLKGHRYGSSQFDALARRGPGTVKRPGGKKERHKATKVDMSPLDKAFALQGGIMPNLQHRISNLITARIQSEFQISGWFTNTLVTPAYAGLSVQLNSFNLNNNISTVYDQYRIECVEVWLTPQQSTSDTSTAAPGFLISVVDVDDANVPTNYDILARYQSAVETPGINGHYHRWVPHVAVAAYSGVFTSFANERSPWIDMASDAVQHYGMKVATRPGTQANVYDLTVRATFLFRGIH